jgi:hypothetical protein
MTIKEVIEKYKNINSLDAELLKQIAHDYGYEVSSLSINIHELTIFAKDDRERRRLEKLFAVLADENFIFDGIEIK